VNTWASFEIADETVPWMQQGCRRRRRAPPLSPPQHAASELQFKSAQRRAGALMIGEAHIMQRAANRS
jgi:hypothetical protein